MFASISRLDYTLRHYQQEAKEKIFGQWDYCDNILYQMPTGTGKTRLFTSIIRDIAVSAIQENRRKGILIIAHRTELIEQIAESLKRYRVSHGIIAGGFRDERDLTLPVQVASIQTITHPANRSMAALFNADYIIIDEAHHAIAPSYKKLWSYYPHAKKLGVTATPWRMDGRGFREVFDVLIPSMSIKSFLEQGWLAPYVYYSVPLGSELMGQIESIKEYGIDGDYKINRLEEIVDTGRIRSQLLDSYLQLVNGKKGIIYSISRKHSKHICAKFLEAGIRVADIDSLTPALIRKQRVQDFKAGKLDILVNVDIFSEGFDCPDLEFVQLARPTRSLVKYIQQVGRGLRPNGTKQCVILDNVGMYGRFGLPDDEHPWETYFEGNRESHLRLPRGVSNKNTSATYRERDLSEGDYEMQLIQQTHPAAHEQSPQGTLTSDLSAASEDNEIRSALIYSKYNIIETTEGYFIENVHTRARQFLSILQGRRSISLKLMKNTGTQRGIALISSFNRDSKPSTNDRIIGHLYKEGRMVKFTAMERKDAILVKI